MSAHFSLSDIDAETPVKNEKSVPESSKPRIPNFRTKSAKKRKNDEVIDLFDPAADAVKATELLAKRYYEKVEVIDDMRRLADVRIAAHDKDAAELAKLRKENKEIKSSLNKHIAEADTRAVEMKKMLVEEVKRDATIAVLEARILMATEAAFKGYDTSIWTVDTWKAKLAKLKGEDPETEVIPVETSSKSTKTLKATSDKAPKQASSKAPKSASHKAPKALEEKAAEVEDPEDVTMAEQDPVADVLKDLAAADEDGVIPGDEGINDQPEPGL